MDFGGWQVWRSAGWIDKLESRRAGGLVSVQKPETLESWRYSSSFRAGKLNTQEEQMFQSKCEGRRMKQCPSSKAIRTGILFTGGVGVSAFLFYSGLWLIGWYPPTLGRATCFIQSYQFKYYFLPQPPHRHTQNSVCQIYKNLLTQSSWHYKFDHHRWWHYLYIL